MSFMLRRTHRCIAIDMVGHGETTPLAAERYDVGAQVRQEERSRVWGCAGGIGVRMQWSAS